MQLKVRGQHQPARLGTEHSKPGFTAAAVWALQWAGPLCSYQDAALSQYAQNLKSQSKYIMQGQHLYCTESN